MIIVNFDAWANRWSFESELRRNHKLLVAVNTCDSLLVKYPIYLLLSRLNNAVVSLTNSS